MPRSTRRNDGKTLLDVALSVHMSSNGSSDELFGESLREEVAFLQKAHREWEEGAYEAKRFDDAVLALIGAAILEGERALEWQI